MSVPSNSYRSELNFRASVNTRSLLAVKCLEKGASQNSSTRPIECSNANTLSTHFDLFHHLDISLSGHPGTISAILLRSPVIFHLCIKLFLCLLRSSVPSETLSTSTSTTSSLSSLPPSTWAPPFPLARTRAAGTTASAWDITIDVAWWRSTDV